MAWTWQRGCSSWPSAHSSSVARRQQWVWAPAEVGQQAVSLVRACPVPVVPSVAPAAERSCPHARPPIRLVPECILDRQVKLAAKLTFRLCHLRGNSELRTLPSSILAFLKRFSRARRLFQQSNANLVSGRGELRGISYRGGWKGTEHHTCNLFAKQIFFGCLALSLARGVYAP